MGYCGPVDGFPGPSLAAHWTGGYGTRSIVSGRAAIGASASYSAITTSTGYSLTSNEMVVEVDGTVAGGQEWYFMFRADAGGHPGFGNNAGTLYAYTDGASVSLGAYNGTTHRWVRIRNSGSTIYWDTSPDGVTWTNRHTDTTTGYTLGSGYVELGSGNVLTYYDNLNNPPSNPAPVVVDAPATVGTVTPKATATVTATVVNASAAFGTATPTATATVPAVVVNASAAVSAPSVSAGADTVASPLVVNAAATVLTPTGSGSVGVDAPVVNAGAVVYDPIGLIGSGDIAAMPLTVRATQEVLLPGLAGALGPVDFPGVLKRWDGSAWEPGTLKVFDEYHRPGTLHVALTPTALHRSLIDDFTAPHEGVLDGVPTTYDWGSGPRVGYGNTPGPQGTWTGATPWGQIYPEAGHVPTGNTRCAVRRMGIAVLSTTTGEWTVLQDVPGTECYGAYFQYDFSGNATGPQPLDEDEDGNPAGVPGFGFNMHFFPNDRVAIADPSDIAGVIGWFEARIETVPGHIDDTASARFLAGGGGDWWLSTTAPFAPDFANNGDWSIGRHRFLSTSWQTFTGHTLSRRQIRLNPPPLTLATA